MRILHVTASADPSHGGPIEVIRQLHQTLRRSGHLTEALTLDDPASPDLKLTSLPVTALGTGAGGYQYTGRLVPWLMTHAAEYDFFIINGIWQYSSFGAWRALTRLKRPYCVFTHGMLDPWFKHHYPLKHLKKSLYWPWGEYRVLRDARAVCFTCEEERLLAKQSFRPYRCREVVVNYGTAAPEGDPASQQAAFINRYPELNGKRLLLFLSRIHPKKGCDLLIHSFARMAPQHPDLHLVIAGPDQTEWIPALRALSNSLDVSDRITWTGMLTGDLKWGAFRSADAFILPSHQENFGISVAEALACGLPVLISDRVNIWREIVDDNAGIVARDDQQGIDALIRDWLALTPERLKIMKQNAMRCFITRFEIEAAAQSLIRTIRHCLNLESGMDQQ